MLDSIWHYAWWGYAWYCLLYIFVFEGMFYRRLSLENFGPNKFGFFLEVVDTKYPLKPTKLYKFYKTCRAIYTWYPVVMLVLLIPIVIRDWS